MNPWLLLGAAVVWALSLFVVGKWQREDGQTAERVAWQAKDNAQLSAANAEIQRLNNAARAEEQQLAVWLGGVATTHEKEIRDADARRRADVAAARDGALKLRVAGACPRPGPGAAGETSTAPGVGNDATTGELPPKIAGDLLDLANDADQIVHQLTACQAVVNADRGTP